MNPVSTKIWQPGQHKSHAKIGDPAKSDKLELLGMTSCPGSTGFRLQRNLYECQKQKMCLQHHSIAAQNIPTVEGHVLRL